MTVGTNSQGMSPDLTPQSHVIEWDDDQGRKPGLCCLQGCLAATAVGFSFFVALPTGIILVVLSANSHDTTLLAVGCVLVSLPVIMLLVVIILCLNQKRLCCNKIKEKKRAISPTVHITNISGQVETTPC
ncbi:unnamed protein product [Lymnaea stagnalis]|uniref:Uncharacterized protein n=1 Tax=Lymnaea stagnalis TaxID=6523 RepID=A0AAV2H9Y7_LYMST